MGFGTLFFGYFVMFAFSLSNMYFFADIIGSLITAYAFTKLAQYNRYFNKATIAALAFLLFSAVNASNMMFDIWSDGYISTVVNLLRVIAAAVTHIYMFLGARGISLGAEADKLAKKAERNLTMTVIYYVAYSIVTNVAIENTELDGYFDVVLLLYYIVCLVMNLAFIYRCFTFLAPADEDVTERKRSRFRLINMMDDKMDEIEAKKQQYRMESMQMALEEAEKAEREKKKRYKQPKKRKKK